MFAISFIVAVAVIAGYLLRRNFRRAFYILRTGDLKPDWRKLGYDYYWPEKKGKGKK